MNVRDLIRVARQQVTLATRGMDPYGIIALYIEEIPIHVSTRRSRTRMGFFCGQGEDVGRITINLGANPDERTFMDTLYHELAHAIVQWIYKNEADCHGPKWQTVMAQLGRPNATRHS